MHEIKFNELKLLITFEFIIINYNVSEAIFKIFVINF